MSLLEENALDVPFGAYERAVLRAYVLAYLAASCRSGRARLPLAVMEWCARDKVARKLDLPHLARLPRSSAETDMFRGVPVALTRAEIERARTPLPAPSALQKRLDWVARTLQLDAEEAACLSALCRLAQLEPFRPFSAVVSDYGGERDEASAELVLSLVGARGAAARRIFHHDGTLRQLGLIEDRNGGDFAPSETLLKLLRRRTTDPRVLEGMLLGESFAPTLELADFDHMRVARDEAAAILSGCLDRREHGVGMLFYGPPGTGKTELAALLGRACGARVVFAGELDAERSEPDRADRLAHLALVSAIAHRAGRVIVAVDEADDIFTGVDEDRRSDRTGSKVFVNRLVESCRVPTIWITNHPGRLGPAVIRRLLRAVEIRPPGASVRRRIVDRHAASLGLGLDEAGRARLAAIAAPPAVLASALRATSLGDGTADMAVGAALSLQRAMGAREPLPAAPAAVAFDAALSSADVDLAAVERAVAAAGTGPLSFLFTGLPGTGKSAFARHLAGRLGMEVLEKRASDLLGMFVGQTEAQIAEAFEEAADGGRFLIFDEADSLLLDRREATRAWEISQVNEMLTWMERHPLPFAATSNLADRLDPAVQRRFTFKARFRAMTRDQIALAFERHFAAAAPEAALRLDPLTPGDFAVVARQVGITGVRTPEALAGLLALEVSAKPHAAKPIGFA